MMKKKKQNKLGYISGSVSPIYNGRELAAVVSYINKLISVINVLVERVDLLEGEVLAIEKTLEETDNEQDSNN